MQITDLAFSSLKLIPISDNLWKLSEACNVVVNMPAGKGYRFRLEKDFATNLRSGTDLINPIIPRHGNEARTISYILHDANYTTHYFSREFADDLLKAMLTECDIETCEQIKNEKALPQPDKAYIKFLQSQVLGTAKIWAIHKAVRLFGSGAFNEPLSPPYDSNENLFSMAAI